MSLSDRLLSWLQKDSQARMILVQNKVGRAQPTPANYENLAKIGFGKSAIVYTCISKIAGSARGLKWSLYDKTNPKKPVELSEHPLLSLWNRPNPLMSTADFVENMIAYYCLTGNSYVEANRGASKTKLPLELWIARPDKMRVIPGENGLPAAYEFSSSGQSRKWDVDFVNLRSDIWHWKTFNPIDDWYGIAPLQAAMLSLDQNVSGQEWNLALLRNSATPSGVLQVKVTDANPRGEITDEQYRRMRKDYEENYQGVRNTGKPMIIEGGLSWTQISHSPKDLDYLKGKEVSSTDICLVFGIPPELIGLGEKTFNNYREARLSLFEETILPTVDSMIAGLNHWLSPAFSENGKLYLDYDKDSIDVLAWKREQKYTSLGTANFLTQNEKREAVGYETKDGWDVFIIGNQIGEKPEDFSGGGNSGAGEPPPDGADSDPDAENPDPIDDETPIPQEENPEEDGEPSKEIGDSVSWKSINLLNANEKRASWARQNRRRKELQGSFDRDMRSDFKELIHRLKRIKGNPHDARLTEFAIAKEISDFMPEMGKTIKRHVRYTLEDFGGMVLGEGKMLGFDRENKANVKFEHFVRRYTESRSGEAIKTIESTSQKTIKRIVGEWVQTTIQDGDSAPELSKFLEAEFEELTPAMATRIARTEIGLASNNGSLEAVKSLQIPNMFKEWVTANDDRVRDGSNGGADHGVMNGAEVGIDEKFGVPPDALMEGPGDPAAGADQVINCRCVLTYRSRN